MQVHDLLWAGTKHIDAHVPLTQFKGTKTELQDTRRARLHSEKTRDMYQVLALIRLHLTALLDNAKRALASLFILQYTDPHGTSVGRHC